MALGWMGPRRFLNRCMSLVDKSRARQSPSMGPPRPIVAHTRRSLSASASHTQWMVEACTHHSTATATATAAPGVVLCVADGIVRIVVHVAAGEDLGWRLRRGIDRLIGVTAGEDKRYDHDRDAEPHGRFPTHWSRPGGRSFGEVGHHALRRRGGDLIEQRRLNFNSMRG